MHESFNTYPELMFVDTSIRQRSRSKEDEFDREEEFLHLIVLSGVDNEGQNILFACGVLKALTAESLTWLLNNFRQASQHPTSGDYLDPEVIITDCSEAIDTAVEVVFGHQTTHLYC